MAPPATPRYRFPSPDDVPRPRTDPPRLSTATVQTSAQAQAPRPQFATPAPPASRRQQQNPPRSTTQTPGTRTNRNYNRGFSPDPDFFTPSNINQRSVLKSVPTTLENGGNNNSGSNKRRRRSFDLDEIDEALLVSGKPRVLGNSAGGWKVPDEYFGLTPVGRRIQGLNSHATPTPSIRRPTFRHTSAIISSPPGGLNLSFGDTQEDVQDDDDDDEDSVDVVNGVQQKKRRRRKSIGVFDDIESIASSLPGTRDDGDDEGGEGGNRKENSKSTITTKSGIRTPSRVHDSSSIPPPPASTIPPPPPGEKWMAVPDQPQLKLPPPKSSPTEKLNKAICAMAWSPSHRRRRGVNNKYLNGGLAGTVLGWAYDAQDLVLRSNMVIVEQNQNQNLNLRGGKGNIWYGNDGGVMLKVESIWEEEGYAAIMADEEDCGKKRRVILIGDENSGLRKDLGQGSLVEVRMPMWEVVVEGEKWTVGINWRLL
ncbi:hypothetical protein TWF506_008670 [Arthrobotrys conoides]|uniref:Uncharacterized protein n=1 Tax=Arthrobotrys conoides TaxID=74498 RepID=A0AAN8NDP1_9PEZI